MVIGTHIDGHKSLSKNNELLVYSKPKKVYIPLICGNDTDLEIKVKKNEHVYKGEEVACRKGNFSLPIHSSVSGKVLGFEEHTCFNSKKINCVVIENDFLEKYKEKEEIHELDKYTKEEFIELLKQGGIRGLGGADFPTYVKYQLPNIKYLVINAVECEPYITADYILMKESYSKILECCNAIMKINNISICYIAIKKENKDIINLFNNVVGTYPNIKIVEVPNLYPMGWEKNIIRYIFKEEYDKLPSELGIVVNNVSTINSIYNLLKTNKPLTTRIVTLTGEMLKKPVNMEVKIGIDIMEVIKNIGLKYVDYTVVAGGPMMGVTVPKDELIVTSNLNCVLVLRPYEETIAHTCMRCGKCIENCPAKIPPVLIKENINNKEELKELNPLKCVECGLCSYVCPARIDLRDYVRKAKKIVRGEKYETIYKK